MITEVSLLAAFIAGILSISSPCILPLLPIYLAHIAGVSSGDAADASRSKVLRNAVAFTAGFSLIFIGFGLALGAVGSMASGLDLLTQNRVWIVRFGGVLLVFLGLYQLGAFKLSFLDRTHRLTLSSGSPGSITSSFLIGVTFGAGWSPCVGPILGGILTIAAGQGSIERAGILLTAYTLGLAIPFITAAYAVGSRPALLRRINGNYGWISTVSGAVMLGVGMIMLLGIYQRLFVEIIRVTPWTPWEPTI